MIVIGGALAVKKNLFFAIADFKTMKKDIDLFAAKEQQQQTQFTL